MSYDKSTDKFTKEQDLTINIPANRSYTGNLPLELDRVEFIPYDESGNQSGASIAISYTKGIICDDIEGQPVVSDGNTEDDLTGSGVCSTRQFSFHNAGNSDVRAELEYQKFDHQTKTTTYSDFYPRVTISANSTYSETLGQQWTGVTIFPDTDLHDLITIEFEQFDACQVNDAEPKPVPMAVSIEDVCDTEPPTDFTDTAGTTHEATIGCVGDYGIAAGYPDGTYRPGENVSAAQNATFIVRMLEAAGVDTGSESNTCDQGVHAGAIGKLVDAGIMVSCNGNHSATRSEMAEWTAGALEHYAGVTSQEPADYFADDDHLPVSQQRFHNIVADLGIVTGKGNEVFAPTENLSRGQMATFLARSFAVLTAKSSN